jgi:hypothetical protein
MCASALSSHVPISNSGRSIKATFSNLTWNGNEFSGTGSTLFNSFAVNGTVASGNNLTGQACHFFGGKLIKCKSFSGTGN